jgi:hypothetical protein
MRKGVNLMELGQMQLRRPTKGRPRRDDRGEILAYFAAQQALGKSVSEIAMQGLNFQGYKRTPDGKGWVRGVVRRLSGSTLETRYWLVRAEVDQSIARATTSPVVAKARYLGISAPVLPLSFPKVVSYKRGRPKKIRTI